MAFTIVELLVVLGILTVLVALLLPAIGRMRAAADKVVCQTRLHQLGVALHLYHQNHSRFPPGCSYEEGRSPQQHLTWMARLLPYLEQEALWQTTIKAFEENPFFLYNPPHIGVSTEMPPLLCPADERASQTFGRITVAFTSFQGVVGRDQTRCDGMLYLDSRTKFEDCRDGAEHTLMVGERPASNSGRFGWWYAGWGQDKTGNLDSVMGVSELNVGLAGCPPGPYEFARGNWYNECDSLHFWSHHPGGAHFLMVGGAVHFLRYDAKTVLPALATRAGHEPITLPE